VSGNGGYQQALMGVGELAIREGQLLQHVGADKDTGGRHRLGQGLQRDVDPHHEGVGKEGLQLEGPDAGADAHVQHGADAFGRERGQIMVAQGTVQGVMLIVQALVFQRVFGQDVGHISQILALAEGRRMPGLGQRRCRAGSGCGGSRLDPRPAASE
jgi:hypothetical protein